MDGVSAPKPTGTQVEAVGSKKKTRGEFDEEPKEFVQVKGRRKKIGEEETSRYKNVSNDNELIERKICAA